MNSHTRFRAVVVLFHPDDAMLDMIAAISRDGYAPIVIVNAIDPARLAILRANDVEVVVNAGNDGLARAFNQGLARGFAAGADYVMLLDQDTRPPPGMARQLVRLADRFARTGGQLGCIGPTPVDRKQPEAKTLSKPVGSTRDPDLVEVGIIISSGMTVSRAAYQAVGGMWNELFIDHVDHEWCFRARAAGFAVLAATSVPMPHNMGDDGWTLFGRYQPIQRSPLRHFHITRNTLWLARCSFIPARWRITEIVKLAMRLPSYVLFSNARGRTLRLLPQAMRVGLRRPSGHSYNDE